MERHSALRTGPVLNGLKLSDVKMAHLISLYLLDAINILQLVISVMRKYEVYQDTLKERKLACLHMEKCVVTITNIRGIVESDILVQSTDCLYLVQSEIKTIAIQILYQTLGVGSLWDNS